MLTVDQGLAHETVYDVVQDSSGFVWFATAAGVWRFDGVDLTNLQDHVSNTSSFQDLDVSCLLSDHSAGLWIGSWGRGLAHFDLKNGAVRIFRLEASGRESIRDDRIQVLYEDSRGRLWVGTFRGLDLLDRQTGRAAALPMNRTDDPALTDRRVWSIAEDREGRIWIGTDAGLAFLEPTAQRFTAIPELSGRRIRALFCDRRGSLWAGTQNGLLEIQTAPRGNIPSARAVNSEDGVPQTINEIFEDSRGMLWIGTQRAGLYYLDEDRTSLAPLSAVLDGLAALPRFDVRSLFEDQSGILWVATRRSGVILFDLKTAVFQLYRDPQRMGEATADNVVHSLVFDSAGRLWAGTDGGLLVYHTDGSTTRHRHRVDEESIVNDSVEALAVRDPESLWVGTSGGLDIFDVRSGLFQRFGGLATAPVELVNDQVQALIVTQDGSLWVGTRAGLHRIQPTEGQILATYRAMEGNRPGLSDDWITVLLEDSERQLWIGTEVGGLVRLSVREGDFAPFRHVANDEHTLSSDRIQSLYEDPTGGSCGPPPKGSPCVWVATPRGLDRLDVATERVQRFGVQDGLPSFNVTGVIADRQGFLWISTIRGLCRFDVSRKEVRYYSAFDGLQGPIFSPGAATMATDGRIFFGGLHGINGFDPQAAYQQVELPRLVLTSFGVGGQRRRLDVTASGLQRVTLRPSETSFYFEFADLDYRSPRRHRFFYRLKGLDQDWRPTAARRQLNYSNVEPGDYLFQVRFPGDHLEAEGGGISVAVRLLPVFWKTAWFRGSLALVAMAVVGGLYRLRISNLQRNEQQLQQLVESRTLELATANERLEKLALTDGLTGILNQRRFWELLETEWRRARRAKTSLAVVFADIDHFKEYNDHLGHQLGDGCLKQVAAALTSSLGRSGDACARYGGDEFASILIGCDQDGAASVAETMRRAIENLKLPHPASVVATHVTVSLGFASARPEAHNSPRDLVAAADSALYRAKKAGRNCVSEVR